jgi:beta-N-acetylhexosaminidase
VPLAAEPRSCGADFSFAPVLDLDYGESSDRALGPRPAQYRHTAGQKPSMRTPPSAAGLVQLRQHFPGHGFVTAPTPIPTRWWTSAALATLGRRRCPYGSTPTFTAVMPAHTQFGRMRTMGFSAEQWLTYILRGQLDLWR